MKTLQLIIAILLFPLSIWYPIGVAVRNLFYNLNLCKSASTDIITIGVGNLRMGGTGKTPHTEYLVRLFNDIPTALLSRGYGRKTKGFQSTSGNSIFNIQYSQLLGDEPAMIARKFPSLTVAVCKDRLEGVAHLAKMEKRPRLILLDDVFQHRRIKPSALILLTEYGDPFFNDHILPFGNLREFRSGRNRADIVVVTKCPTALSESKRDEYRQRLKLRPSQKLFFSYINYSLPQPLYHDTPWQHVKEVLLLTGIAHPAPLKHYLETRYTVTHLHYPDHHNFSAADCHHIAATFHSLKEPSKAVVTTEKDALRMLQPEVREQLSELPVFYIPIQVAFLGDDTFDQTIKKFV